MSSFLATTRLIQSTCRRNAVAAAAANSLSQGILGGCSSSSATPALSTRFLSTHGQESVGRFREALEDYRAKNYAQTIPPRFRKKIITGFLNSRASPTSPMSSMSEPNTITIPISVDEQKKAAVRDIERFLQNIGAFGGDKVTHEDVESIVSEIGESVRPEEEILADKIVTKLF
jgi:hypothetical protein